MSIQDSTTTLDTAWTEQSIAQFTSGVLTNETACVTEVESKLKRGTLASTTTPTNTQVKNWLVRAKEELMQVKDFSFGRKFAQATLSAGDYRVALPNDYDGDISYIRDTTNKRAILILGPEVIDKKYPDMSSETQNDPITATVKNMELWLSPPVDSSTVLEIEYQRSGAPTTASDFEWLPEVERFRCCDFAIGMAFESIHQFELADRYLQRWAQGLGMTIKADGRRKWKRRTSCINVFQEYSMLNNQINRVS